MCFYYNLLKCKHTSNAVMRAPPWQNARKKVEWKQERNLISIWICSDVSLNVNWPTNCHSSHAKPLTKISTTSMFFVVVLILVDSTAWINVLDIFTLRHAAIICFITKLSLIFIFFATWKAKQMHSKILIPTMTNSETIIGRKINNFQNTTIHSVCCFSIVLMENWIQRCNNM